MTQKDKKEVFIRTKPHCNIGTIGHVDHGKTTTASALSKFCHDKLHEGNKFVAVNMIDKTEEERNRKITINATQIEYSSDKRHYAHIDCPGHNDYIKNMITGAAQMDGAILVVSAEEGVMLQTREHVRLAKQIGIDNIVVFVNKVDLIENDEEIKMAVESDIKDILKENGYDIENTPFIFGSALAAIEGRDNEIGINAIGELIDAIDRHIEIKNLAKDKPFSMWIDGVINIKGRGTVVTGKVESGILKIEDELYIQGLDLGSSFIKTNAVSIETFGKILNEAIIGDSVGILLRGISKDEVKRGHIISHPNSQKLRTKFRAKIYLHTLKEDGRENAIHPFYRPQCFIRTANVTCVLSNFSNEEGETLALALPGEYFIADVEVIKPIVANEQTRFSLRESKKTIGSGVIIQ